MITEEVRQIITKSKFDPALKQRLILILPRLGKYTLSGLGKEVSRGDSLLVADNLVLLWENFANLLDSLKIKNEDSSKNLSEFLTENLSKFNGENELYILNFVLDLRAMDEVGHARLTDAQYSQLLDYEVRLFWELPKEEVMFLLQNRLLFLESKVNLLEHMKALVWDNEWDYKKDFNTVFSDLLLQNKEKFAGKTVGDWIKDYFNFSSPSTFRADVVQVAEFLVKSPLVQKLNSTEKKTMSEILKLYVWFLKPEMDEDEILSYKEQIADQQSKQAEQMLLRMFSGDSSEQPNKPTPPIIPLPKNQPAFRPIEEIRAIPRIAPVVANAPALANKQFNKTDRPNSARPVNIQDILKSKEREDTADSASGLRIGNIGTRPLPRQMASPPKSPAPDINKKLEELSKKINKIN